MDVRAVVFDLWETLVRWPGEESRRFRERWAGRLGVSAERLDELWYQSGSYERQESGPLAPVLQAISEGLATGVDVDELMGWRLAFARTALVPDAGVTATLIELRRRDLRLGLVSNCTEDVALVWAETQFAPLFDAAIFSSTAGCMKPSPEIYALVCHQLDVEPSECLFVGDGANDELGGAARVGMTPVLVHRDGEQLDRGELRNWPGLRITSIPDVLELVP